MFDIITFGSATQDIYLKSKKFLPVFGKTFTTGQGICLTLGSKVEVEAMDFYSGGGGTNTAATFANQGLKVAYCGQIGNDLAGLAIIEELKKLKINTSLILKTGKKRTNHSVFLAYPGKDRTILAYRGASDILEKKDIPWGKIKKTKWFYLAPFSGKLASLTEDLINFAKKKRIKVAWNPGYDQLKFPKLVLKRILKEIDVLILNKEEASQLAEIPYQKEKEIFKKIDKMVKGIVIMTKGGEGVAVSDGRYLYRAPSLWLKMVDLGLKFVDATGAGDAFGAGFVSGMIRKNDMVYAIQLAMANSGWAIRKWGAKEGLLTKNQSFPKVQVETELCYENGLCQIKI